MAVALATAGAMATIVVFPVGSSASSPEKEFSSNFEAQCVLAPGVLNIQADVRFAVHLTGPESTELHPGEEVTFKEASATITLPVELVESFVSLGATSIKTKLTRLVLDATGMQPPEVNLPGSEGPHPVEKGKPLSFSSTPISFTEKVTAAPGERAGLSVDSSPGFEGETGAFGGTGKGIEFTVEAFDSEGGRLFGPATVDCTAPASVTLASYSVVQSTSTTTTTTNRTITCTFTTILPIPIVIGPDQGPEGGGTEVVIEGAISGAKGVFFGGKAATHFEVVSAHEVKATTPPGHGTVEVDVQLPGNECGEVPTTKGSFTYLPPNEKAEYNGWVVSGTLTDKRLGQAITLPSGSTFNGSGELNNETGAGSVTGNVSIPAFTAPLKLFGVLPVSLGVSLTQSGAISGTVAKSEVVPGAESLSLPLKLNVGLTSVAALGLKIPVNCATAEPLALPLASTLTREELLLTGWSFSGTATLSTIHCEGGLLGRLFGAVLSALLSGPENAYALSIKPPSG